MTDLKDHSPVTLQSLAEGDSQRCNASFSDFEIKCRARKWKVHKAVLAMHSPVLGAACTGDFMEGHQGFIDLSEESLECIEVLHYYLYNFNYSYTGPDELEFHVQICIMADKYDIQPLKLLAATHFKRAASKKCLLKDDICAAVRCAYGAPHAAKEIREHLVKSLIEWDVIGCIAQHSDSKLEQMMREIGDFATDLAKAQRAFCACQNEVKTKTRYQCSACDETFVADIPDNGKYYYCYDCGESFQGHAWQDDAAYRDYIN